ncbi:hypothetical protein INT80_09950 [Gallibacterium anatis]|uniref:Uncharacterized protein n=1 Tax=Gallibacterium anatis TaxID=750 RepID=A0A930UX79_9PAST|nr:hypothetical protein [Gallibacterium anatis]
MNIVQYYLTQISLSELQQRMKQYAGKSSSQYSEVLTTYFYLAKQQLCKIIDGCDDTI